MKALRARAILASLAAVASLIILTTACVDSPQSQPAPPRAAVSAPAPTSTPPPPEPTATTEAAPTAAPEPTAMPTPEPANTPEPAPEPTAAPAPTSAPAPSAQAPAATGSPADMFQSAATAMNALSSYRAEMEHILAMDMMGASGDIKTEVQADVQAPDKMGGDMIITLTGEPPITNGFVIIGDDGYVGVSDPDNPQTRFWIQSAPSEIAPLTSFLTWFETGSDYEFAPAELVGTEDLNGEETRRLRGSFTVKNLPDGVEQPEDMEADVWIGASDNLIRKIAAAGEVEEIATGLEIAISYSRFDDASIQVEAPTDFIAP